MPLNTPETTASADRVPKTGVETFGGSGRAHGTGLGTTPTRAGPRWRRVADRTRYFYRTDVVPASGHARRPPRPRGPWQGGVRGSRDVAAPGRSGPRRPRGAGRLPRPGTRRGHRRTRLAGRWGWLYRPRCGRGTGR